MMAKGTGRRGEDGKRIKALVWEMVWSWMRICGLEEEYGYLERTAPVLDLGCGSFGNC